MKEEFSARRVVKDWTRLCRAVMASLCPGRGTWGQGLVVALAVLAEVRLADVRGISSLGTSGIPWVSVSSAPCRLLLWLLRPVWSGSC